MLDSLMTLSQAFMATKHQVYRRYFIKKTQLSERFSIFAGERGVGKTTCIIQYLLDYAQNDRFSPKILYVQADHFALGNTTLYEIAEQFCLMGGECIAFDEIHKYANWSKELKSIYDTFGQLKIIASGSSALEIYKGSHDLSRRAIIYRIVGSSLREYLELLLNIKFPVLTLTEILKNHQKHADEITKSLAKIKQKILPLFHDYLQHGYYPYYFELRDATKFFMTLEQNIHTTLESDLSSIHPQLTGSSIYKIKQLLMFIAQSVPFTPNWNKLKTILEVGDERTLKTYFKYLEDAALIKTLHKSSKKLMQMSNPAKIYLSNPNQVRVMAREQANSGTIREIFMLNMLMNKHEITLPTQGDFLVSDSFLFEIGGKNKSNRQIQQHQQGFLVCDNIEIGIGNKIPLWLFGFLY